MKITRIILLALAIIPLTGQNLPVTFERLLKADQEPGAPQKVQVERATVPEGTPLPSHGKAGGVTCASWRQSARFCAAFFLVQDLPPVARYRSGRSSGE